VSPGDKIYAPPADLFYVSGQVKSPGTFTVLPGMSVRMALSRAGGVTDLGSDRAVKITRDGKAIKPSLDSPIQAGDVVVVGERLF
jgi:polysaccharide export outer membrane protein